MEERSKYRIVWSKPARNNLEKIGRFIEANFSQKVADSALRAIFERVQLLSDLPYSGKLAPAHASPHAEVRYVIKAKSKIYYLISETEVHILAVMDTRQNPPQP